MPNLLSSLSFGRVKPPTRRVLALDAGNRSLKLLLAESEFGRLRIVKEELTDLQAEGLVSAGETKAYLQATLADLGRPPVALVLPQHLSISQTVELPPGPESEIKKVIHEEVVKLSGASEKRIAYDFVRTGTTADNRQQFWVTLGQEGEVRDRITGLGIEQGDLCEVTTTASALVNAFRAASPSAERAILAHLGAQTTVLVILVAGRAAFVTSFQMGGDFLTRALARILGCPEERAEAIKRESDLLRGETATPEFAAAVDGWVAELKRQLNDWFEHNPALAAEVASFKLVASGGGFDQPGLLDYLRTEAALAFQPWPQPAEEDAPRPAEHFEAAFGAALQALGHSAQPVSLLPGDYRANWQRRLARQRVESFSVLVAVLCALLLGFGTWQKLSAAAARIALLTQVRQSRQSVESNNKLSGQLRGQYEDLRPLLASQQFTLDTLKTLALIEQSRSNRSFWYVVIADQQYYFRAPPMVSTNKPAGTNAPTLLSDFGAGAAPAAATNAPLGTRGLIAELCVPEGMETARGILSELVSQLEPLPIFSKVDLLPDDQRRNVADPKVVVPDRFFALEFDFAATEFEQPVPEPPRPTHPTGLRK